MKIKRIFSIVFIATLMSTLAVTTAISCFATPTTDEYYNKNVKTYRVSTKLYYTTMACIPGYTTMHPSDDVTGFDSNYKYVTYDEYDEDNYNLTHTTYGENDYLVSTNPYQTVNSATVIRKHTCQLKTGENGTIIEQQCVIITSKASL